MKKLLILSLLAVGFLPLTVMAQTATTSAPAPVAATATAPDLTQKLVIAKQYSALVPMQDEVNGAIEDILVNVPKDQRTLFKAILERYIKVPQLTSVSEMALAETFTENELKALVAFYKTPEGQAIKNKMPVYKEKLNPTLEQMVRDAVEAYQAQQTKIPGTIGTTNPGTVQ